MSLGGSKRVEIADWRPKWKEWTFRELEGGSEKVEIADCRPKWKEWTFGKLEGGSEKVEIADCRPKWIEWTFGELEGGDIIQLGGEIWECEEREIGARVEKWKNWKWIA